MAMLPCETCNEYFDSPRELDEHEHYCKEISALKAELAQAKIEIGKLKSAAKETSEGEKK